MEQQSRVKKYAEEKSVPISFRDSYGNWVLMVDVTPWGQPVYMTTDNVGSSQTIGANQLQQGGTLGLDITGENITVGVWDGGIVASHIEFEDRLLSSEGSSLDDHATHVTGTIASGGINNPNSKGMAPKAKIIAWDFNNDEVEALTLVKPDQTTLLLSNHSYGLITGWRFNNGWTWFGNASISTLEDHRFGFYNGRSRAWDDIMFNSPYYTMVKSAGNDRSDAGNGTIPADCNGGAGFDCLGDLAVCKNNIVVGAVSKQPNYTGAASVLMSSFSSWGPTDDGRIKPDLVAAGVGISSTFATGSNAYGLLSGTSMSTPSVTGGLALLQDLYKQLNGDFMRSATLKALAIHTTKEAGPTPGPDYMFGWGLLDVERAAKVILEKDGVNTIITESVLSDGQVYELPLTPVENEKITLTIVWTDPAGNPVAASVDPINPMLVNDLDVRIVDDGGSMQMPWKLDPQDLTKEAVYGDNILDNVEKIEFSNPQNRNYKIRISHKGELLYGQQAFSLIVTYKSIANTGKTYYWVGGSGLWTDQSHWSLSSGGLSANEIPTLSDRVFFDENSLLENSAVILVSTDIQVGSIAWFSNGSAKMDLNGNEITLGGGLVISNPLLTVEDGSLRMTGESNSEINLSFSDNVFNNTAMIFDGLSQWKMRGRLTLKRIQIDAGSVNLENQEISVSELMVKNSYQEQIDIRGAKIKDLIHVKFPSGVNILTSVTTSFSMSTTSFFNADSFSLFGTLITMPDSQVEILGNSSFERIVLAGNVKILGNNSIGNFELKGGLVLTLNSGSTQTLTGDIVILSSDSERVVIKSSDESKCFLNFSEYEKICFDFLNVQNVNAIGDAVVNAGVNSLIDGSAGWISDVCDQILFPNFSVNAPCVGALMSFKNLSQGSIENFNWNFNSQISPFTVTNLSDGQHSFSDPGIYQVTLTVSNGDQSRSYTQSISIIPNSLENNTIILSNGRLSSVKSAKGYQWFRDAVQIPNEFGRSYLFEGTPGAYFVVTQGEECNRISSPFIVLSTLDGEVQAELITIFPNPVSDKLIVRVGHLFTKHAELSIIDLMGRNLLTRDIDSEETAIATGFLSDGMYLVKITSGPTVYQQRVLVNK